MAHNFGTDSCSDCYDDCYELGMIVAVGVVVVVVVVAGVVGISAGSFAVYADDYFVMRTIVSYLVRAPDSIVVDWVMEVVSDCFVKVVAELVTASMVVDIVIMIRPLTFQRSIQIHCL